MWPLIMAVLRRNAVYITLPVAALVGVIGYNIEGLLSDKYTPYIRKFFHFPDVHPLIVLDPTLPCRTHTRKQSRTTSTEPGAPRRCGEAAFTGKFRPREEFISVAEGETIVAGSKDRQKEYRKVQIVCNRLSL